MPRHRLARTRLSALLAAAGLVLATAAVTTATAAAAGTTPAATDLAATPTAGAAASAGRPQLKLIPAQSTVTVLGFGRNTYLDPGIWLASLGAPLQFSVTRASYAKPVTLTQVLTAPGGQQTRRPLSAALLDRWNGLKNFANIQVFNAKGVRFANRTISFCPSGYDPQRATDGGPLTSPYPIQCGTFDPFPLGEVWGIADDWAVDPVESSASPAPMNLPFGTYKVTETITRQYEQLFAIPAGDTSVTVTVHVVSPSACCSPAGGCCIPRASATRPVPPVPASFPGHATSRTGDRAASVRPLPELPASVPTLKNPPASVLPDLVSLPSWGISVTDVGQGKQDVLDFGATVWVGGNGPLDVEGFRQNASPVMPAYQYYYDSHGQVIGRTPAGTMGFDSQPGHNHWHFQQFAKYQLLGASKQLVLRSAKVGFCIAPTDQVDLTLPGAVWQTPLGFAFGTCGSPTALWVREQLPVGWGDTYQQYVAGQAFDITTLPNGTYYIEIIANPQHVLHEISTSNDVSFRQVILSGTRGHRHVTVPAWNGIDPEKS